MTGRPRTTRRRAAGVLLAALLLVLAACAAPTGDQADRPADGAQAGAAAEPVRPGAAAHRPLRLGERFELLTMPAPYTPSPPYGEGTDDYRCFLLDPGGDRDTLVTGLDVLPGTPGVVHHVVLFGVPPEAVPAAEAKDAGEEGPGWTCFGGSGLDVGVSLDSAPWLGAWAPGGGETLLDPDVGVPMPAGSRVVMQVHYNLLAGPEPDRTATRLRVVDADRGVEALETMLLPAPVELPCRPAYADGPLCERTAALADVARRVGSGFTANALHLLCGRQRPGPVQRCERTLPEPATVRAVAGHMHLLGRSIRIEANPGTPRARTLLDLPVWDFDDQAAQRVDRLRLRAGDTVRITCEHDQALRDALPAFDGQPDRYVVWGEGTTDEMCLGLLMVTRP